MNIPDATAEDEIVVVTVVDITVIVAVFNITEVVVLNATRQ